MSSTGAVSADPTAAKARLRVWLNVLKTSRHIEKELRERFRDQLDSTLPRFDVMAALDRSADGLKMTELSSALRVSNGNVTPIVDRLVDARLVDRHSVEGDRRAQLIRLTRHGRETFAEHAQIHEGWVDELLGDLSTAKADQLMTLLDLASSENRTP